MKFHETIIRHVHGPFEWNDVIASPEWKKVVKLPDTCWKTVSLYKRAEAKTGQLKVESDKRMKNERYLEATAIVVTM